MNVVRLVRAVEPTYERTALALFAAYGFPGEVATVRRLYRQGLTLDEISDALAIADKRGKVSDLRFALAMLRRWYRAGATKTGATG
jgi:hypothetical protein